MVNDTKLPALITLETVVLSPSGLPVEKRSFPLNLCYDSFMETLHGRQSWSQVRNLNLASVTAARRTRPPLPT